MSESGEGTKTTRTRLPDQDPAPIREKLAKNSEWDKLKARGKSRLNVYGQEAVGTKHSSSGATKDDQGLPELD